MSRPGYMSYHNTRNICTFRITNSGGISMCRTAEVSKI